MGFLGEDGQDCAFREMSLAIGPCYLGCILNPFEWGADTEACKKDCESGLPGSDELIGRCLPEDPPGNLQPE